MVELAASQAGSLRMLAPVQDGLWPWLMTGPLEATSLSHATVFLGVWVYGPLVLLLSTYFVEIRS